MLYTSNLYNVVKSVLPQLEKKAAIDALWLSEYV